MFSVVLPSRGRPASLCRAVTSLARGGSLVEILVGLDDDDPTTPEAKALIEHFPNVRVLVGPRLTCQAAYYNYLVEQSSHDFVGIFADDYTVDQDNWAELMEADLACLPNGYGVVYFNDPMYPFFATYPFISKKTVALNVGGKFLPEFFPFLFGDTWLNEVGAMSGLIIPGKASITIDPETGHIHRFSDLQLWSEMFHVMRPLRADIAVNMIRHAFGTHPIADQLIQTMPERTEAVERMFKASSMTQAFYDRNNDQHGPITHPDYPMLKARAEAFMADLKKEAA